MNDKILGNQSKRRAEIILKIAQTEEPVTLEELSKKCHIDKSNVNKHLKQLRKENIVIFSEPRNNESGKEYISHTNKINDSIDTLSKLLEVFTDDEILELMQTKYFDNKIPELTKKFQSVCKDNGITFNEGETDWLNLCLKNSITLIRAVLCDNLAELLEIESEVDFVSTIYGDAIPKTFKIFTEYIADKKVKSPVDTTDSSNKVILFATMRHLLGNDSVNKRYIKELGFEKAIQFARTRHSELVSQYAYLSATKFYAELGMNTQIMDEITKILEKNLKSSGNKGKNSKR